MGNEHLNTSGCTPNVGQNETFSYNYNNFNHLNLQQEEIFKCQCPCANCYNTNIIEWHHYGCPKYTNCYISDQAMIRCGRCGMNSEFLSCKFDCGNHGSDSSSTRFRYINNLKKVMAMIGAFADDGVYSFDFADKLGEALKKQWRKKNFNY